MVQYKSLDDPVTEADIQSQGLIINGKYKFKKKNFKIKKIIFYKNDTK
jgi:hypothetical protein